MFPTISRGLEAKLSQHMFLRDIKILNSKILEYLMSTNFVSQQINVCLIIHTQQLLAFLQLLLLLG